MSIVISRTEIGEVNVLPGTVKMTSTDGLATITTAGYLNRNNLQGISLSPSDVLQVLYSYVPATNSGSFGIFTVSISAGVITLSQWVDAANVLLPVVNNDFAVFNGTAGQIADLGYSPTNASKTKVIMANGATVANHIMVSTDTAGTSGNLTGIAINDGGLQAGRSGVAGTVGSFPSTATSGELILAAVTNATGNFNTTISNAAAVAQSQVITIPDSGAATSNFALSQSPLASNNLTFTKVVTATFTQLATAGKVNIAVHPSATSQFAVLDIKVFTSTGLSGGGGNRLLALTDGTIVFNNAGITAAVLGTPIFTLWGGTGNPVAVGTTQVSTAGADIYLQYSGGTTDYTAGSVQVAITLVQVAA